MDETSKKPEPDSRSYSEKIRELIEKDYVGGARNLLAVALADRNRGEDLSRLQRVLAPQKFLRADAGELGIDRTPDYQWIKEHMDQYRGQWVAVFGGELLAHSQSLCDVVDEIRNLPNGDIALLHRIY